MTTNNGEKFFKVHYTDESDFGCPVFTTKVRAYNRQHAEERFFTNSDDDGWRIVEVEVIR